MIETPADRAAMRDAWGEVARLECAELAGLYAAPGADAGELTGDTPVFSDVETAELAAAGAVPGARIETITTHDGRTVGPFRIAAVRAQDDGVLSTLQLEALDA